MRCTLMWISGLVLLPVLPVLAEWRICDVTRYGAVGDGIKSDTLAIRAALADCNEVILPVGRSFVSGPLNLTSNQQLSVRGALLASQDPADYPLVQPIIGYGWSNDGNCFPPDQSPHKIVVGKLRYSPVVGAYNASNVSVVGSGVIDGRGEPWWSNCTLCHYPPHNDSAFCEIASRPKLLEFQFVSGLRVHGDSTAAPLHLKDSPFWTLTPSYSQDIHIHDLRITAPMDRIGNTDGVNLDSCRNAVVENIFISNSDDGICMKSGLNGFGLNLGIPTENVVVQNITCDDAGRGGFAIGSEMSGGVRNVTYRNSKLGGGPESRGIIIKPSVGRGGYIQDLTFENIIVPKGLDLHMGRDGQPLMPGNDLVPLISNLRFVNLTSPGGCRLDGCSQANRSRCFNMTFAGALPAQCRPPDVGPPLMPQRFGCKTTAKTQFGIVPLPWGVCIPKDAPVNINPAYPNWGPLSGDFVSLEACNAVCSPGFDSTTSTPWKKELNDFESRDYAFI